MDCAVETGTEISETPNIVMKISSIICQEAKAEMEAAIWLLGVLEVVATRRMLQRPGGSNYNLLTPLEKWYCCFLYYFYSVRCFSLIRKVETANTTDVKNLLRLKQLFLISSSVLKHQKTHTEYQWSVQEHIEISKICSLPPDLLIQGKTGPWPVKGAPSKVGGGPSIGRKQSKGAKK